MIVLLPNSNYKNSLWFFVLCVGYGNTFGDGKLQVRQFLYGKAPRRYKYMQVLD